MAWQLTRAELVAGRDEVAIRAQREHDLLNTAYEGLARAHRWLDEEDEAVRWFRATAAWLDDGFLRRGPPAVTGGLLWLARDTQEAHKRLRRAARGLRPGDESERSELAEMLYLLGDYERAVDLFDEHPLKELGLARAGRSTLGLHATREWLIRQLRADRVRPDQAEGEAPLHTWDWLEECFAVEHEVAGEPPPSHQTMLHECGLLVDDGTPGPAHPDPVPRTLVRPGASGLPVDVQLERSEDGTIDVVLDPDEYQHWSVDFEPGPEGTWATAYKFGSYAIASRDEKGEWFDDLAEAVAAAADRLRAEDADWAAETLLELMGVCRDRR